MIKDPRLIIVVLVSIEIALLYLSHLKCLHKFFDIIPIIFWLFAAGMILANAGILDRTNPIYQQSIDVLLPAALFLILITVDVRSILHLGPAALIMFFAGMVGVMVGMVTAFAIMQPLIGAKFAEGFGALTGSWTGGSANMIAVKEALNVPNDVFTLLVIIDSTIPYVWMAFLIFLCPRQQRIDAFHKAKQFAVKGIERISTAAKPLTFVPLMMLALIVSVALAKVSAMLPVVKGIVSPFTWTIILVTVVALCIGVTRLGHWAHQGLGAWGQWMLFFVLLCIGTKGDLSRAASVPWLLLAGLIVLSIHALFTYVVGRLIKAPLFLMVCASQANLGGVASASMVAEIYHPGLAGVGLLMAILGNIVGTYAGILTGQICRLFT